MLPAIPGIAILTGSGSVRAETLEESWQIATAVNHRLQADAHRIESAKADLREARSAKHPVFSNQSAYITLSEQPHFQFDTPAIPPLGIPSLGISTPLSDQSFAVSSTSVRLPLYTGGKITAAIDANRYRINAVRAEYASAFLDVKMEVTESYFNVLRARRLSEVARNAEKSLFAHRQDVGKMFAQKMVTRNALLAAQAAWAAAAQEAGKAENTVLVAESAFNRYLGRPLDFPVFVEEVPIPPVSGDLASLTHEAMRCRKELTGIASQSQAAAALARVSHSDRLPQVLAVGTHNYLQNSSLSTDTIWAAGVGVQWTFLDGGASRAREQAALHNAAFAAKMRDETRSLIELQVRSNWIAERETRSRVDVAELGKTQSDENLRVVTRQFLEGLVNHTEVLDAQTQQTAAWTNLANATYDAILATYRLKRSIGLL